MREKLNVQFAQVPLIIIQKFDTDTAVLWGLILSKEGLHKGYCYASQKNLAIELNVSINTIKVKMGNLLKSGLIKDISNTKYNNPGITRKYIVDLNVLEKMEKDSKANSGLLDESEPNSDNSEPNFDLSKPNFDGSKPNFDLSKPNSGYKIYKEIDRLDILKDISIDIREQDSEKADFNVPKKEKKTWKQAFEEFYKEPITNIHLVTFMNCFASSEKTVEEYPNVLKVLTDKQDNFSDYVSLYNAVGEVPF